MHVLNAVAKNNKAALFAARICDDIFHVVIFVIGGIGNHALMPARFALFIQRGFFRVLHAHALFSRLGEDDGKRALAALFH